MPQHMQQHTAPSPTSSPVVAKGHTHERRHQCACMHLQETRRAYRELYMTCPGLGEYVSGAILFKVRTLAGPWSLRV